MNVHVCVCLWRGWVRGVYVCVQPVWYSTGFLHGANISLCNVQGAEIKLWNVSYSTLHINPQNLIIVVHHWPNTRHVNTLWERRVNNFSWSTWGVIYIYIYTYIYISLYIYIYTHTHIYRERERQKERNCECVCVNSSWHEVCKLDKLVANK